MSVDPFAMSSQGVSTGLNVVVQGVKGLDVLNKNLSTSMSSVLNSLFSPLAKSLGLPALGQAGRGGALALPFALPKLNIGQAVPLSLPNIADFGPLQLGKGGVVDAVTRSGVNSGLLAGGTAASRDDGPATT